MQRLKEIGLFRVFLGVETNAVAGLATLGRGIRREQNAEALEILREASIHTCFNLLMFDPETTLVDLRENIAFLARQAEFPLNFCRVEVYAGTDIERQLREENRLLGDYFGYSYLIRDPRVQAAYEMFRRTFYPRNFALDGMNHRAMQLDYYFHILRHFHPRRATASLEKRVKGLVRELNGNSAEILGEICDLVDSPAGLDPAAIDAVTDRLAQRRTDFDRRMDPRMRSLLDRIRRKAARRSSASSRLLATAASVAAMLAAGTAGCDDKPAETHMHEKAPAPLEPGGPRQPPPDTAPCEVAPEPFPPSPPPPSIPEPSAEDWTAEGEMDAGPITSQNPKLLPLAADKAALVQKGFQKRYSEALLKAATKQGLLRRKVSIYLELDAKGQIDFQWIRLLDLKPGELPKEREIQKILGDLVKKWSFPETGQAGACRLIVAFKRPEPKKPRTRRSLRRTTTTGT